MHRSKMSVFKRKSANALLGLYVQLADENVTYVQRWNVGIVIAKRGLSHPVSI